MKLMTWNIQWGRGADDGVGARPHQAARFQGEPVAYCPFIFVDQDVSLMRGLIQGWPKQFGTRPPWWTRFAQN